MLEQAADPKLSVVTRLRDAMNEHDLEALVDVFDSDFVSETPAHPQRTFRGADQVRRNWEQIFAGVPDLQADLLDAVVEGDTVWSEWDWHGTRRDGSAHRMRGVTIQRVKGSRAVSVRFYMEPVDAGGPPAGEAVRRIVTGEASMAPAVRR
jgi:ketosteroid isomerase-like protein